MPPPSDLVVTNVQIPDSAYPGDGIEVTYQLENEGIYAATGWLRDGIYVSLDSAWDIDDALLGYTERSIDIPAGASMFVRKRIDLEKTYRERDISLDEGESGSLLDETPGVTPGTYRIIVRADVRNNIRESNDGNNSTTSADSIEIQIESLQLGVPEFFSISGGAHRYYQVQVGANQDLKLDLASDDVLGSCEILVALNRVPSLSDFDWSSDPEFDGSGSVLVPNEDAGLFYLLIRNNTDSDMQLLATALDMSAVRVIPDRIGKGVATCRLEGAGFNDSVTVSLVNTQGDTLLATVVEVFDRISMDVRFDANDAELGMYSVLLQKPGNVSAVGANLVTVEEENFGDISLVSTLPNDFQSGELTRFTYTLLNNSNVDVPYTVIQVGSASSQEIHVYTPEGAIANAHEQFANEVGAQEVEGLSTHTYTLTDLRPNQSISCIASTRGEEAQGTIPLVFQSTCMYLPSFLASYLTSALSARLIAVQDPNELSDEMRPFFTDTLVYVDMVLGGLDQIGLVDIELVPDSIIQEGNRDRTTERITSSV